ncbi:MAG: zinc dependent phospholipase C family protein [Lachnospiraceae bacterium]
MGRFPVREMDDANMQKHWKAFYFGSILPDLTPKMITDPHEFDSSYLELKRRIAKLLSEAREHACKEGALFCRLGVVMHYLADYFTFPHNTTFEGNLRIIACMKGT